MSQGKDPQTMDDLAKDARKLADLRHSLASQISEARKFMNNLSIRLEPYESRKKLLKFLEEEFEPGVTKRLDELDQIARDLLQIVSQGYMALPEGVCLLTAGICVEFGPRGKNGDEAGTECHAAHICQHFLSAVGVLRCE